MGRDRKKPMKNNKKPNLKIGLAVDELLKKREWSYSDLADKSGLSIDSIKSIMSGRRTNLSSVTLTKLSKAFGVDVDYFIGSINKRSVVQLRRRTDRADQLSPERVELLQLIDGFDNNTVVKLLGLARDLAGLAVNNG